jgi:hypothetical protein
VNQQVHYSSNKLSRKTLNLLQPGTSIKAPTRPPRIIIPTIPLQIPRILLIRIRLAINKSRPRSRSRSHSPSLSLHQLLLPLPNPILLFLPKNIPLNRPNNPLDRRKRTLKPTFLKPARLRRKRNSLRDSRRPTVDNPQPSVSISFALCAPRFFGGVGVAGELF